MEQDGEHRLERRFAGADALSGHDPADGKELWRWDDWNPRRAPNWPLIASPVAGDGVALVCVPKREPVYAIKAGGSGVLDDRSVAWASREAKAVTSEVPTPAYCDGDFLVFSDSRKSLSRVERRISIATPHPTIIRKAKPEGGTWCVQTHPTGLLSSAAVFS